MTRRVVAIGAAIGYLLAGPVLAGPAGPTVLGHANLVVSSPAPGQVVATSPTTLTITFSEPFEPAHSSIDLLDGSGTTVLSGVGDPDPSDPHTLDVPLPELAQGVYTVDWRTVSATDGHAANGFFTFGVGQVSPPPAAGSGSSSGDLHAGHGAGLILVETEGRTVADLGLLLAVGLAIAAGLVLRSSSAWPAIAAALVLGAIGALTLGAASAASAGSSPLALSLDTRAGRLLAARAVIAVIGVGVMVVFGRRGRPWTAVVGGGVAGLMGLGLLAEGGHAAGFDDPAPLVAAVIHLVAAAAWLGGLAVIVFAVVVRSGERPPGLLVPRFSAVALVSIALVAATGLYADWRLTGAPLVVDTPYAAALVVKIALVVAALGLGAVNYLDGGRAGRWRGGLDRRVVLEGALAFAVVVAAATVASGSPPGLAAPVPIAPAFSSATAAGASLALEPGWPGPTSFLVTLPTDPGSAELVLTRTDAGSGSTRLPLTRDPAAAQPRPSFRSDGGSLPARSAWDATVVVHAADGTETGRTRFVFAIDAAGVASGRLEPAIDLGRLLGLVLLIGAAFLVVFTLAGGVLPRVEPRAGRLAALVGAVAGAGLGIVLLIGGGA